MEFPQTPNDNLTMADGRHFTGAIYPRLDNTGFEKLTHIEEAVASLESGEAVSDEAIAAAVSQNQEFYIGYFSQDTQRAQAYIASPVVERAPGRAGQRETAIRTFLTAFEAECLKCGMSQRAREESEAEIMDGWDRFAQTATAYLDFALTTYSRATEQYQQPDYAQIRQSVAAAAYQSFQRLLVTMDACGPLPMDDGQGYRKTLRVLPGREKTPRAMYYDIQNRYLDEYKRPEADKILNTILKQGYLQKATVVYGEQAANLTSGSRSDPKELYVLRTDEDEQITVMRPRTPSELAKDIVDEMLKELLYGNSSLSATLDASSVANGNHRERRIRKLIAFQKGDQAHVNAVVTPATLVPRAQAGVPKTEMRRDAASIAQADRLVARNILREMINDADFSRLSHKKEAVTRMPEAQNALRAEQLGAAQVAAYVVLDTSSGYTAPDARE